MAKPKYRVYPEPPYKYLKPVDPDSLIFKLGWTVVRFMGGLVCAFAFLAAFIILATWI